MLYKNDVRRVVNKLFFFLLGANVMFLINTQKTTLHCRELMLSCIKCFDFHDEKYITQESVQKKKFKFFARDRLKKRKKIH